jgi:hypothetical protein
VLFSMTLMAEMSGNGRSNCECVLAGDPDASSDPMCNSSGEPPDRPCRTARVRSHPVSVLVSFATAEQGS